MATPPPPILSAAARVPGLLSIQRILLLVLLALAPALALAQARQMSWSPGGLPSNWTSRINDTAVGTVNLFDVHRNPNEFGTGLKLAQQTQCTNGGGAKYGLRNDDLNSGHTDFFSFRNNDNTLGSGAYQLLTLTNTAIQHVTLNFKANQSFSAEATLSLLVSLTAQCDQFGTYRAGRFKITLLAQRNIRTAESLAAAGAFRTDRLLANANAVTTGIVFQRGTMRCPTNMTLLNHTDYLRLQHMNPTGNALTGALATAHSAVAMGGTNARALALLFKAGATVTAGTLTIEVKVDSPASNTACPAAFARTITAKVTAAAAVAWTTGSNDAAAAASVFATPVSGDQPTGIKIHRYAGTCATMEVSLPNNQVTGANNMRAQVRDIMQLRGVNGSHQRGLGGLAGLCCDGGERREQRGQLRAAGAAGQSAGGDADGHGGGVVGLRGGYHRAADAVVSGDGDDGGQRLGDGEPGQRGGGGLVRGAGPGGRVVADADGHSRASQLDELPAV